LESQLSCMNCQTFSVINLARIITFEGYIEDKLNRIADALAALNTKTTALGALPWAVANKRVELPE